MSDGAVRRFFGGLLMAVGALIATLSGLCSLVDVALILLRGAGSDSLGAILSNLGAVYLTVGVPFLIGVGLLLAGRWIMRRPPR